jgi:MYXO-CTERM domain-containing protein
VIRLCVFVTAYESEASGPLILPGGGDPSDTGDAGVGDDAFYDFWEGDSPDAGAAPISAGPDGAESGPDGELEDDTAGDKGGAADSEATPADAPDKAKCSARPGSSGPLAPLALLGLILVAILRRGRRCAR